MRQELGRYSLVEKLGEGSMGAVYRAFDNARSLPVAIRIIPEDISSDPALKARLIQQSRSAANLRHPNIVTLHALGEEKNITYVAMELLEGRDLKALIRENAPIPIESKLSVMIQLADGLHYAHKNGIIHQNLKPGNIHLTPAGIVKIRDFGSARTLPSDAPRSETSSDLPVYFAPEQILGKEIGAQADIFSAGIVFYELLTNLHPFRGSNVAENILSQADIPTVEMFSHVPLGCWPILETCLEKDPNDRQGSMAEVGEAFRELLEDIAEASDLMFKELQMALPLLKQAAERPGFGIKVAKLLRDVQKLLSGDESADHQALQSLMVSLADHHALLRSLPESKLSGRSHRPPVSVVVPYRPKVAPRRRLSPAAGGGTDPYPERPGCSSEDKAEQPETWMIASAGCGADVVSAADVARTPERAVSAEDSEQRHGLSEPIQSGITETQQSPDCAGPEKEPEQPRAPEQQREPAVYTLTSLGGVESPGKPDETEQPPSRKAGGNAPQDELSLPVMAEAAKGQTAIHRLALMSGAGIFLLLLVIVTGAWVRGLFEAQPAVEVQLQAARLSLEQKLFDDAIAICRRILQASPNDEQSRTLLDQAQRGKRQRNIDGLLREAQGLLAQGRFEESRTPVRRVLEMDPGNARARALWNRSKSMVPAAEVARDQEEELKRRLANVSASIKEGNLEKARAELDRIQQLVPEHPEALALRRRWSAKHAELSLLAQKQEETARRRADEEEATRQAETLIRQGKYTEALALLEQSSGRGDRSARVQALWNMAADLQRGLKLFESALRDRRYEDALAQLVQLEQKNPADPSLAEFRRRVESSKASARAWLTVFRLGEPALVMLDDQQIAPGGEVESRSIAIGKHKLAVRNSRGLEASQSLEFVDGQKYVFVYDAPNLVLRPMTDGDLTLLNRRKTTDRVHRFSVEHKHFLRGKCEGELVVNYYDVEFKPKSGAHGFRMPFRSLKLKMEGGKIELFNAIDNKEFRSFEVRDAAQARNFQQVWGKLEALGE